jgi:hypothetical protein
MPRPGGRWAAPRRNRPGAPTRSGDEYVGHKAHADDDEAQQAVRDGPQALKGVERQDEPARLPRGGQPALEEARGR